jgi:hypothetical protein
MSWREVFVTRFGPPVQLAGITLGDWLRLLRDNDFAVDPPYWARAVSATLVSIANSLQRWREERVYGPKVAAVQVKPPVFILGHWRTGTTHLHNLLSVDPRFAYPNTYQVSYPHTFLSTEALGSRLTAVFLPAKRPMDDVRMSFQAPNEDEFALCATTGLASPYLGSLFPRRQDHYDRFLTFRGAPAAVVARWKAGLVHFLRKLTWKYDRPLVLKSPPHTCRVRLLLELFPDARFVHIRRNPYTVFQSSEHWLRKAVPWFQLQRSNLRHLGVRILRIYKEMYDVYFEERGLIPHGRLHEVCFEELDKDPLGQVRGVYEALDFPDFNEVEPALRRYVESLAGYKKNTFGELPADLRQCVAREWRRYFEEWGYPT